MQLSRLLKKLNIGNYIGALLAGKDAGAVVSIPVLPFEQCSCRHSKTWWPGNLKIPGREGDEPNALATHLPPEMSCILTIKSKQLLIFF